MAEMQGTWQHLLDLSAARRRGETRPHRIDLPEGLALSVSATGQWSCEPEPAPPLAALLALYLPFAAAPQPRGFVVGHLGQSLDGRIATVSGASQWITGEADVLHNHRMRALSDAVLVGAGTLRCDDPQLTVRSCAGPNPTRVVLDTNRTLDSRYRVFHDGAAPTIVISAADRVAPGDRLAEAEILPLPRQGDGIAPPAIRAALAERGLCRLFLEGGGVTVSRFLAAGCLERLQIAVSPVIIGSGRPSITLPEIADLGASLRPTVRRFELGDDMLFECIFETAAP